MIVTRLSLLLLVTLASCSRDREDLFAPLAKVAMSLEESDAFMASLPYGKIVLDHQPYLMARTGQDQFRVEFARDRSAALRGRLCESEWGDFTGKIGRWEYGRLCELLSTTGVEALEDNYTSDGFHGSTYILSLLDDDGHAIKEINEFGHAGPSSFWAAKCAVEAVMNQIDWVPVVIDEEPSNNETQTDAASQRR